MPEHGPDARASRSASAIRLLPVSRASRPCPAGGWPSCTGVSPSSPFSYMSSLHVEELAAVDDRLRHHVLEAGRVARGRQISSALLDRSWPSARCDMTCLPAFEGLDRHLRRMRPRSALLMCTKSTVSDPASTSSKLRVAPLDHRTRSPHLVAARPALRRQIAATSRRQGVRVGKSGIISAPKPRPTIAALNWVMGTGSSERCPSRVPCGHGLGRQRPSSVAVHIMVRSFVAARTSAT